MLHLHEHIRCIFVTEGMFFLPQVYLLKPLPPVRLSAKTRPQSKGNRSDRLIRSLLRAQEGKSGDEPMRRMLETDWQWGLDLDSSWLHNSDKLALYPPQLQYFMKAWAEVYTGACICKRDQMLPYNLALAKPIDLEASM